jgi:phosphatidylserine/phosphatidylglycerophosphate/cardiolipin synthase-like enzyme
MPDEAFDAALQTSLEDRRLSRGERQSLTALLAAKQLDDAGRLELRRRAFELAGQQLAVEGAAAVLQWLEEIVKLLVPNSSREQSVAEVYFSPGEECPRRIARMFEMARESADVCVFTITDDRIASAMEDAHRRGVRLRVITDNDKAFDLGSDAERLAKAGVPVKVDRTRFHMHHKFALFDGRTLLSGSYNWTRGAARDNEENFIISDDPRLVAAFADQFERMWENL